MGDHAEDAFDYMTEKMCNPKHWRRKDFTGSDTYDPNFRNHVHKTIDGRVYRLGDMQTSHLVNIVLKLERDYRTNYGLDFWNQKHTESIQKSLWSNSAYRNCQCELAYRRFIQNVPFECELHPDAVEIILTRCKPESSGTVSGRFVSKYPNHSNIPKETKAMQHRNMISILQKGFYTIGVKFPTGETTYTYKVPDSLKLEKDDYVVVGAGVKGYSVAKVVRVDTIPQIDLDSNFEYTWIVQRVDPSAYLAQKALEEELKAELQQVEIAHQRETAMEKMTKYLPEDSIVRQNLKRIEERAKALAFDVKPSDTLANG